MKKREKMVQNLLLKKKKVSTLLSVGQSKIIQNQIHKIVILEQNVGEKKSMNTLERQ